MSEDWLEELLEPGREKRSASGFSDIYLDGTCVDSNVSNRYVKRQVAFLRTVLGDGKYEIIETRTFGVNDEKVFENPVPKNPIVEPRMGVATYDVYRNGKIVEKNVPEDEYNIVYKNLSGYQGVRFRNLPSESPAHDDDAGKVRVSKKVSKNAPMPKPTEKRYSGVPKGIVPNYWVILSRETLEVLHEGSLPESKAFAREYLRKRGHFVEQLKVVRTKTMKAYIESCEYGFYNGENLLARGSKDELRAYTKALMKKNPSILEAFRAGMLSVKKVS